MTAEGGRGELRPPARFRLRRSIELFEARDGSLYLLRLGAGDDFALQTPRERDRVLLSTLSRGYRSRDELRAQVGGSSDALDSDLTTLSEAGLLERHGLRSRLNPRERERYDRQMIYFADLAPAGEEAEDLQVRLRAATVVLVGCGGLGSWVAAGLSGAGVGRLVLIDDDRIELSNLNRQILFNEGHLGERKIDAARESLLAHNGALSVVGIEQRIRGPEDLEDVVQGNVDLVVATADWPPHHLPRWVNQVCVAHGVPWIGSGQFPPRLRVGPLVVPGRSACGECLERATRRECPLYDEIAEWRARRETPDSSIGAVSGVIGSLIASEAIHFLTQAFEPRCLGAALVLDLQTMQLSREEIETDPTCPECSSITK